MKKKRVSTREFVEQSLKEGVFSPSKMCRRWNQKYGLDGKKEAKTRQAFTMAMRRMGVTAKKRLELKHEAQKAKEVMDIEDYPEVKRYLGFGDFQQIGTKQKKTTLRYLRVLWEAMGRTNPREWSLDPEAPEGENLIECLKRTVGKDENGQWKQPSKVMALLGAFNRTFTGRLPRGYSMGLKREAGELKDFEFSEFREFRSNLTDTPQMNWEGWGAIFTAQVNSGAREGTDGKTGILSLKWENINYETRRCKIRDKGKKGKPARLWTQIPLDMFYWLEGWEALLKWHELRYGYKPTKERHATGECFPVKYDQYRIMFHATRRMCKSRISQKLKTMRPHIFRKTHAQWAKRIGVSLENLCGNAEGSPFVGRYGVGWDDPKVPLKYYLVPEPEEYKEQDRKIEQHLQKLMEQGIIPIYEAPLTT